MREVKSHVFDDNEEGHPETFKGKLSEKIIMVKNFIKDIEKRFVKNEKSKICTLLTNFNSIKCKDKEAANTVPRKRQQKLI